MRINRSNSCRMILAFLFLLLTPFISAQEQSLDNQLIEAMIRIVLENNPLLKSQEKLVGDSRAITEPRTTFALSGIGFNVGAGFWNTNTDSFDFIPTATIGLNFSPGDPSRLLNILRLKKEKEETAQEYQNIKNAVISDLFTNVREVLRLESQKESLEKLKVYLEDYSDLIERQVKAGVDVPQTDKLWDLKERAIGIEVELKDVESRLSTIRLETAMTLGGDAYEELLNLLWQLGAQS